MSPRTHDVEIRRDLRVPTADPAITLSADVYLPADAPAAPALLTLVPYRKDMEGIYGASLRWFAERGYPSILAELRGVGASDGTHHPKFDPGEGDDAAACIAWAARQPWCDGTIGMWGHSSGAFTTMRAATQVPPELKAVIALMTAHDPGRESVHHDGARVDLHQRALWSGSMLVQQLLPPLLDHTSPAQQRRWYERLHHAEPFLLDLARGPADPVWSERAIDPATVSVPTFCVGGWRDLYADSMVRAYAQVAGARKLLVGPWTHSLPQNAVDVPIDFLPIALRWWEHWLRGIDTGLMEEPPVTVYTLGHDPGWHAYRSWPPAKAEQTLATGGDTTLTETAAEARPSRDVIAEYLPDPTTGALSGLWGIPQSGTGVSLDQHDDDLRAVSATSTPLAEQQHICGRPEVTVRLATEHATAADAVQRLVVRLADVDSDGRSTFITAGVLCPDRPSDEYTITLRPIAYRVPAGHRLRVVVSDSDFPRLRPLPAPRPIRITAIRVCSPTVAPADGDPVSIPAADRPATGSRPAERRWTITRDAVNDGIDVAIGWSRPPARTSQGHHLEVHTDLRARVRRDAPDAATANGSHKATVELTTGEEITATASVRCTRGQLWAHGEVTIDGVTHYSRTWTVPLSD